MATFTMDMPPQLQGDEHDAQQLRQYLVRLVDRLLYTLNHIDSENVVEGGISVNKLQGGGAAVLANANEQMGGSQAGGMASLSHLTTWVAEIVTAVVQTAVIDWARIQSLEASMAQIYDATIQHATIDWAQIANLTGDRAIVAQYVGEKMLIDRLSVTAAQVVDLTVGTLCIKDRDGHYYKLTVDPATGYVTATRTSASQAEIDAAQLTTGEHIVETDLTVEELNASSISAVEALISKLTAARIDVQELFARQATVDALTTGSIAAALGQALNLSSNASIQAIVQAAVDEISTHFIVEPDRIRIMQENDDRSYELQLTENSMAFVHQDTGEELARFSTDLVWADKMRSNDLLCVGRTSTGWYDMTVLETGVADKWRDGSQTVRPCVITTQPTDCMITLGSGDHDTIGSREWSEHLTFTVEAQNAVSYQWQMRPRGRSTWNNSSTGATLDLAMDAERLGREYRCVITGEDGSILYTDTVRPRIKGAPSEYKGRYIGAVSTTIQYRTGDSESGTWTNTEPAGNDHYMRILMTAANGAMAVTDEEAPA